MTGCSIPAVHTTGTARVDGGLFATVETIMQRHGRIDWTTREKAYRDGGWSEFDEKSVPYTPGDVARAGAPFDAYLDLTAKCPGTTDTFSGFHSKD
jgi:hypothetical protein